MSRASFMIEKSAPDALGPIAPRAQRASKASARLRQGPVPDRSERGTLAAWPNEMAHTLRIFLVVLSAPMVIAIAACGADDTAAHSATGSAGAMSAGGPTTSTASAGASFDT